MSVSSIIVATNAVLLRRQGQHMDEVERDVVVQERAHLRGANA